MPWEIVRNHKSCPKSKSWAVVKSEDGELEGCHSNRDRAQRQLAALNAAEEGRMQMSDKELRTLDLPLAETRAKVSDGRTLVGYAAVFNRPVEVDSLRGHFVETILPGAFKKSLRERGDQIKVLFNHGLDPSLGKMPLGKPTVLQEDDRGLYVEVPLSHTDFNDNRILPLIRDGALHGMSIQFEAMEQEWSQDHMERRLKQVALHELGPVTFPAQELATMEIRSREQRQEDHFSGSVDNSAWDGPAAMANCDDAACFRAIAAGEKNIGEPDERQHWALPHHKRPGAPPNANGVRAALAALAGARGGVQNLTNREAAQRHLERHLRQIQAESSSEEGRDTDLFGRHTKFLDRLTRMQKMDLEDKKLETRVNKL